MTKEIIKNLKADFEVYLKENPGMEEVKEQLLGMAGVWESELDESEEGYYYALVKIPINQLSYFGTTNGYKGNRPFTKEVIEFLKSKGVEFVLALIYVEDKFEICSMAVKIDERSGGWLERKIYKNGGSLRGEFQGGWMIYESE